MLHNCSYVGAAVGVTDVAADAVKPPHPDTPPRRGGSTSNAASSTSQNKSVQSPHHYTNEFSLMTWERSSFSCSWLKGSSSNFSSSTLLGALPTSARRTS
eukprot:CAMPEP_0183604478 /NCGR_PEP_ID=MMETSP0371-20130417/181967_1 /TAXON_ID=268820 /ORGANISM="Peridinium aciculiferum, Strain PAER-2" /LENGTH=99 /DNA_ID=CAMNT_0025816575 /DNA_START=543 /DNA_END=842 /DNA_ORIENTATION=-